MSRIALIVNNEGFPIGAFSIEPDTGGDRLRMMMELVAPLSGLHILDTNEQTAFAIYPKELHNEVGAFIESRTGRKPVSSFKSPARG